MQIVWECMTCREKYRLWRWADQGSCFCLATSRLPFVMLTSLNLCLYNGDSHDKSKRDPASSILCHISNLDHQPFWEFNKSYGFSPWKCAHTPQIWHLISWGSWSLWNPGWASLHWDQGPYSYGKSVCVCVCVFSLGIGIRVLIVMGRACVCVCVFLRNWDQGPYSYGKSVCVCVCVFSLGTGPVLPAASY